MDSYQFEQLITELRQIKYFLVQKKPTDDIHPTEDDEYEDEEDEYEDEEEEPNEKTKKKKTGRPPKYQQNVEG